MIRIFVTIHYDFVSFAIKFSTNVYKPKQYKTSIKNINKANREILSIVGVLVIDIHLVTQSVKTLVAIKTINKIRIKKHCQPTFLHFMLLDVYQ